MWMLLAPSLCLGVLCSRGFLYGGSSIDCVLLGLEYRAYHWFLAVYITTIALSPLSLLFIFTCYELPFDISLSTPITYIPPSPLCLPTTIPSSFLFPPHCLPPFSPSFTRMLLSLPTSYPSLYLLLIAPRLLYSLGYPAVYLVYVIHRFRLPFNSFLLRIKLSTNPPPSLSFPLI